MSPVLVVAIGWKTMESRSFSRADLIRFSCSICFSPVEFCSSSASRIIIYPPGAGFSSFQGGIGQKKGVLETGGNAHAQGNGIGQRTLFKTQGAQDFLPVNIPVNEFLYPFPVTPYDKCVPVQAVQLLPVRQELPAQMPSHLQEQTVPQGKANSLLILEKPSIL